MIPNRVLQPTLGVLMEKHIYGNISEGLEIIERNSVYYVRYDAGAHQEAWREDKISKEDAIEIQKGKKQEKEVLFALQRRLEKEGVNPYSSNWSQSK